MKSRGDSACPSVRTVSPSAFEVRASLGMVVHNNKQWQRVHVARINDLSRIAY